MLLCFGSDLLAVTSLKSCCPFGLVDIATNVLSSVTPICSHPPRLHLIRRHLLRSGACALQVRTSREAHLTAARLLEQREAELRASRAEVAEVQKQLAAQLEKALR